MAYKLKKKLANRKNYGSARNTNKIKYIVIHFTANDGDSDEGNGNYFHNNVVKASAHYFVDSDSITQSVPDDHVAWSVGGRKYPSCKATGGGKFYKKCTNTNSLSIEICDDKKSGGIYPSKATIENAIAFTKLKMKEYNVPSERVIRHFDVVGKLCPAYWCGDAKKNKLWLTEFHNKLSDTDKKPNKPAKKSFLVRVKTDLNIRKGPGSEFAKTGCIKDKGTYTITQALKSKDGGTWGRLKSGAGWINISKKYVDRL